MAGFLRSRQSAASAVFLPAIELKRAQPVGLTRKRAVDLILACSGILLLAPLLLLCFLACRLTSPGPAFFRHRRVGFRGRHFQCLKFRTMVTNSEECLRKYLESNPQANAEWAATRKLRSAPRVTAIGS